MAAVQAEIPMFVRVEILLMPLSDVNIAEHCTKLITMTNNTKAFLNSNFTKELRKEIRLFLNLSLSIFYFNHNQRRIQGVSKYIQESS